MKTRNFDYIEMLLLGCLLGLLMVFIILTITFVNLENGSAKVINYAGIIRGGTQRLVKLEISGQKSDELIKDLNDILEGLEHGGTKYNLQVLKSSEYKDELMKLSLIWTDLKDEIAKARISGWSNSLLIEKSEHYFIQSNSVVFAAQRYSDRISLYLKISEYGMIILIILCISITARKFIRALAFARQNILLNRKAYIDGHTGLPNKNKCEELLNSSGFLDEKTTCIMFDLNNLKKVNDSLGHIAGDTMIMNFAHILRKAVPDHDFTGRYGGDEFMAVLYDSEPDDGRKVIDAARTLADKFNKENGGVVVTFAAGAAYSRGMNECTLKILLEKADEAMYENKIQMKAGR